MPRKSQKTKPDTWQADFIEHLKTTGVVMRACELTPVPRQTAYDEKNRNPEFAQAWENAIEYVADDLERVAMQRAREGSDTLLIFLLKGLKPDKYRENRRLEIAGELTIKTFGDVINEGGIAHDNNNQNADNPDQDDPFA